MKNEIRVFRNVLYAFSLLFLITACTDEEAFNLEFLTEEDVITEGPDPGHNAITTLQPDITSEKVIFNGKIGDLDQVGNVKYGFMWYALEGPNTDLIEIEIGTTETGKMEYSLDMLDLPINTELMVCAFISTDEYTYFIGDDVPFEVDK